MKNILLEESGFTQTEFHKFTSAMARELLENSHKGGSWRKDSVDSLVLRICEELGEFLTTKDPNELPDVANMCLMVYLRMM